MGLQQMIATLKPASGGGGGEVTSRLSDDTTTLGSWPGVYGAEGKYMPKGKSDNTTEQTLPGWLSSWSWSGGTEFADSLTGNTTSHLKCPDNNAVRKNGIRYIGDGVTMTLTFTVAAGTQRYMRLYFAPQGTSRNIDVTVTSTAGNTTLQNVPMFGVNGRYLCYKIAGNVTVTLTGHLDNPSLDAVFFDNA
jgi:hypothetical protein